MNRKMENLSILKWITKYLLKINQCIFQIFTIWDWIASVETKDTIDEVTWAQSNEHFLWNKFLGIKLNQTKLYRYFISMIRELVEIMLCHVNNKDFKAGVITRISYKRVGTRFKWEALTKKEMLLIL